MKNLLLISTSYPEKSDGSEAAGAFVADFAKELAMHAFVTVLAPGLQDWALQEGRLTVHRFRAPRLPLSLLKPYNPLDWLPIMHTLASGQRTLDRLTAHRPFDQILALWALPSGYWAKNDRNRTPYSTWALGSDIWSLGRVPLVRSMLRSVLRSANARYADGVGLANDVTGICGLPCVFLPSSRVLDTKQTQLKIATPPYKLTFLGRFHPNKGVDLLLESLSMLSTADWQTIAGIRIAGGGPLRAQVENAAKELIKCGRPISLEGYKNREEAQELLEWGDMVLIPSRIESIPVIFSDAMQLGKPVIASPVGDLPALIRKYQVGALAENVNAVSYAQILTATSLENTARQALNTQRAAEEFSVEASARRFLASLGS